MSRPKKQKEGENPVFSGRPEDLDGFVDGILRQMSIEEMAYYAVQNFVEEGVVTENGWRLPPSARGGRDAVAGVLTDFPITIHLGQSWDRELVYQIGDIIGGERKEELEEGDPNTLLYTAVSDIRANPLCGRFYEGFGEDVLHASVLGGEMVRGAAGDDPFYLKTQVAVKHFTVYQAEWDRETGSNHVGCRELHDIHYPVFFHEAKRGKLAGVMTSYGATNGIPNACSPFLRELEAASPYRLYNISDYGGDSYLLKGMGNDADPAYARNSRQIAGLMIKNRAYSNNIDRERVPPESYVYAVRHGLYDITRRDLEEMMRPQVELWVRSGYFSPEEYPYGKKLGYSPMREETLEAARQAAREGLVLLKNEESCLPLRRDASLWISGIFADLRTQPMYTVPTPELGQGEKITLLEALRRWDPRGVHETGTGMKTICLRETKSGKYLTIDREGFVRSNGAREGAAVFSVWDWGQGAYSFVEESTDTCMYVTEEGYVRMKPREKYGMMPVFTFEGKENGRRWIRTGTIITSPFTQLNGAVPFYRFYPSKGWYLMKERFGDRMIRGSEAAEGGPGENSEVFLEEEVVKEAGNGAEEAAGRCAYAIVVMGEEPRINASEMKDRETMAFGKGQMEAAGRIARAFPGRTIVVIRSDFPMEMEELQKNPNIAAILYAPYGGEFDSLAVAEALFGICSPAGRLTSSWYKNKDMLPRRCVQPGEDARYTVDMKAIGLEENRLSYRYCSKDSVTYPFGYGLSYGMFSYEEIQTWREGENFYLEMNLYNQGHWSSDEVIQIYVREEKSGYGVHIPNRRLAAFKRVHDMKPGECRKISVKIEKKALKKWDAALGDYIVEEGNYHFYLGRHAFEPVFEWVEFVTGNTLSVLDLSQGRNIWEVSAFDRGMKGVERSKERTAFAHGGGYFALESMDEGSMVELTRVELSGVTKIQISAAYLGNRDCGKIHVYEMEQKRLLAVISIEKSDWEKYYLDKELTIPVLEPAYRSNTVSIQSADTADALRESEESKISLGTIRLVADGPGIRLDTIRLF